MTFTMARSIFQELLDAAWVAAPLEACGLLAGIGGQITRCYALTNADASPDHYSMKPEEQFAAVKDMRAAGLNMLGIWHSHPASPARMSAEDMRLAYTPEVVYVILSLAEAGMPRLGAFLVRDGVARETTLTIHDQEGI
jgi:proteasome lid subunit RPN8/RPN11